MHVTTWLIVEHKMKFGKCVCTVNNVTASHGVKLFISKALVVNSEVKTWQNNEKYASNWESIAILFVLSMA